MFDLIAYQELKEEISSILFDSRKALSNKDYKEIHQLLFKNEILLHKHDLILKKLVTQKDKEFTSQESALLLEMHKILEEWVIETNHMIKVLECAKDDTFNSLKDIQKGKQLLHTYFPQAVSTRRYIDKQQ